MRMRIHIREEVDLSTQEQMNQVNPIYRTRFYSDCIRVFQGGGAGPQRSLAPMTVASSSGVRFSELAGTSAGSIVAALLAAGAEPEFLLKRLTQLNFPTLFSRNLRARLSRLYRRSLNSSDICRFKVLPLTGLVTRSLWWTLFFGRY